MRLEFLGTGGGRFVASYQLRATGGFRVITDVAMHVDPGPGALAYYKIFNFPQKIDLLFVSHNHTDHAEEINASIELMTEGTIKKGILLTTSKVVEEFLTSFHKGLVKLILLEPWKSFEIKGTKLTFTPIKHNTTGCGFLLEYRGKKLWYSSDTAAFDELFKLRPDFVVLNTIMVKETGMNMSKKDAIELILEQRPKLAIIQHFGRKLLSYGPEKLAREIKKETGVITVAAKDGMRIEPEKLLQSNLGEWL